MPVELAFDLPPGLEHPVAATLVLESLGPESVSRSRREVSLEVPGEFDVEVEPGGIVEARILAQGFWAPAAHLVAGLRSVEMRLLPTGALFGQLIPPRGEAVPQEVSLRFEQAVGSPAEEPVPRGTVSCTIRDGDFACAVPAGTLDLRLRSPGFVSHYRWGATIAAGQKRGLGPLDLERGGSVVGRVEMAEPGASPEGTRVRLLREQAGQAPTTDRQRIERTELEAKADARGFFQVLDVPEGRYVVAAEREGLALASAPHVTVFDNGETTLAKALKLHPPARLDVSLSPPVDPLGKRWWVRLMAHGLAQARFEPVAEGPATDAGSWSGEGLAPGKYSLTVADSADSRWLNEELDVTGATSRVPFDLESFPVEGLVTLAGLPLEATVWMGGRFGARAFALRTDEAGRVFGSLPQGGAWDAEIVAEDPQLARWIYGLQVERPEPGESARLEVALEDFRVEGRVVDADGEATQGSVFLQSTLQGRPEQQRTSPEGHFSFRGLEEGTYTLQAYAPGGRAMSARLEVEVSGDAVVFQTLELLDNRVLEGLVVATTGPVPGAAVDAVPFVGETVAATVFRNGQTDATGSFRIDVPALTEEVQLTVAAPGYALKTLRLGARRDGPITVPVYRQGGTLALRFDPRLGPADLWREIEILKDGLPLGVNYALRWAAIHEEGEAAPGRLVVPLLEFGEYEVCTRNPENRSCQGGFLPPSGELELALAGH